MSFPFRFVLCFAYAVMLFSCNNDPKAPDVSGIHINLQTQRFEKDFFEIDSTQLAARYAELENKYPSFAASFLAAILNADPKWDDATLQDYLQGFSAAYRPVYDTASLVFNNFKPYEDEIKTSLKYVKHYFPQYAVPSKILTYIGPLDGYGDILDKDMLVIGLHHHLGKNYSLYKSLWVQETYPAYITQRFEPAYININCMKNIVNDLYPEKPADQTLVLQMIEKGKRLFLLQKFIPKAEEHKLIGYTEKQMKDSYDHEAVIWDLFVQNNFLQTIDNSIIKNYIGESPKTQELGDASPGNIGSFAGWQIVKKYMQKNSKLSPEQLMNTDPEKIFHEAKYKP